MRTRSRPCGHALRSRFHGRDTGPVWAKTAGRIGAATAVRAMPMRSGMRRGGRGPCSVRRLAGRCGLRPCSEAQRCELCRWRPVERAGRRRGTAAAAITAPALPPPACAHRSVGCGFADRISLCACRTEKECTGSINGSYSRQVVNWPGLIE